MARSTVHDRSHHVRRGFPGTNVSGAIRMASMLLRPEVVSFLDVVTRSEGVKLRFDHAIVQPESRLARRGLSARRPGVADVAD